MVVLFLLQSNSRTKIGVLEKYKLEGMRKIWKMYTFQVTKMYFLQFKDDVSLDELVNVCM